jgi:RNA polymerase sigma-70 factor (ECF subfamily)
LEKDFENISTKGKNREGKNFERQHSLSFYAIRSFERIRIETRFAFYRFYRLGTVVAFSKKRSPIENRGVWKPSKSRQTRAFTAKFGKIRKVEKALKPSSADNQSFFPAGSNSFLHGNVTMLYGTIEHLEARANDPNGLFIRSDEELLLAYRTQADRRAFEELVQRYEKELYGYLRHYLNDAEMAEDVFQQTFLQVHLKCDQFEEGRKVRPWLYTVATNQAIDSQRRNKRHRMASIDRRSQSDFDGNEGAIIESLGGVETDPGEVVEAAEQHAQLRNAVDALPEQTKQVVMLVYFQGLKYREAADILGIPVGTVKSRLHAAIEKLSESIGEVNLPE